MIDFEPFKPINTTMYLCDNKFHTEAAFWADDLLGVLDCGCVDLGLAWLGAGRICPSSSRAMTSPGTKPATVSSPFCGSLSQR